MSDIDKAGESGDKLLERTLVIFGVLIGSIALFVTILMGYHEQREIRTATPTLATIDECKKDSDYLTFSLEWKKEVVCKGTWDFGGRHFEGDIEGLDEVYSPGAQVQVKSSGGVDAYAMTYSPLSYWPAFVVAGLIAVVVFVCIRETRWQRRQRLRKRPE